MAQQTVEVEGVEIPVNPAYTTADGHQARGAATDAQDVAALRRSPAMREAAGGAAAAIVGSFLGDPNATPQMRENAARVVDELAQTNPLVADAIGEPAPAAAPLAPVQAPAAPAPVAAPAAQVVQADYDLPDDLAAFLDEPDDEPDLDPVAAAPELDDEEDLPFPEADEFDPRIAEMRKQVDAANKRAEHERQLRVKNARPAWEDEAKRVFVLNGVDLLNEQELKGITADSRRGFLKEARAIADRNKQVALRFAPAQPAPAVVSAVEEPPPGPDPRAQRWGSPTVETVDVGQDRDRQERIQRARRSGKLADVVKAHLFEERR